MFATRALPREHGVMSGDYQLATLANGGKTLFSASYGEKMHPGLGPAAEADLLYVKQLNLRERVKAATDEFVIWDIGLGGAANAIAALKSLREISGQLRLISFDNTAEPLEFALKNAGELNYPVGYEKQMAELLSNKRTVFQNSALQVAWKFYLEDFPAWLNSVGRSSVEPKSNSPHAIFYDAFSPAKNPAMWTLSVFQNLFQAIDPARPCALTTYSRSTLLRTTLLLAGFYVGAGLATGTKEETTIAANDLSLISAPLGQRWIERAMRSDSAEPLREPVYSRAKISPQTMEQLRDHPQFSKLNSIDDSALTT